jgi:hypothetical protein
LASQAGWQPVSREGANLEDGRWEMEDGPDGQLVFHIGSVFRFWIYLFTM